MPSKPKPSPLPTWHQALGQASTDKRLDILRLIGACGSISQAAREAGVSYKAAWQAIDTLSNLAGTPLVERAVGGSGGGGALVTPAGQALLEGAEWMAQARQEVLARLAARPNASSPSSPFSSAQSPLALGLRTSMRNQLRAEVLGLSAHQGAVRVRLRIRGGATSVGGAGGAELQARITRDSAQLLDLRVGQSVLALCKATAVQVSTEGQGLPAATSSNALHGVVVRAAASGRSFMEASLHLNDGSHWVGMFSRQPEGPVLRVGDTAVARFDAAAVVIALEG